MTFNKTLLTTTMLTLVGFAAVSANAATDTGTFDVKLDITEICKVTSTTAQEIDFGSFAAGAAVTEGSSGTPISVNCSNGTVYNIGLSGTGFLTDTTDPLNKVAYSLLKATGGAVWGNEITGEVGGTGTGMAADQAKTHSVFASVAANATDNLKKGSYTDTVNITVTY